MLKPKKTKTLQGSEPEAEGKFMIVPSLDGGVGRAENISDAIDPTTERGLESRIWGLWS